MENPLLRRVLLPVLVLSIALFASACASTPAEKEARSLQRGKALLEKKDYARAALEFRNAMQVMPKDAEAHYQIALAYLGMHDAQSAIRALRKALELNPNHTGAQLKLAVFEFASSDLKTVDRAGDRVRGVLAAKPDDPNALETSAIEDLKLGKFENAVQHLQQSVDKSPQSFQAAFNLAKLKMSRMDIGGAEAVLKKAAESAPKSVEAALGLANFYNTVGRKVEAEAYTRKALQLDPKNSAGLLMLVAFQMGAGQINQAEQTYQRISDSPDGSLKPLHAVFLYQQGKRQEGLAELLRLVKQNPNDRRLRDLLISTYVSEGRVDDALRIVSDACKHNPKDVDALLWRSEFSLMAGRQKDAEDDLQTVLHYQPESGEAHYGLAKVFAGRGLLPRQIQELNEALRLNPRLLAARTDLARALLTTNDAGAALTILDQAPKPQKKNPTYIVTRNWVLIALNDNAELRKGIDEGLSIVKTAEFMYQDALLRMNQKDYTGARVVLERLMAAYPESASSLDLLAQSYAVEGNISKALQVVEEYVSRRPTSAYLRYSLGVWQIKAQHLSQARESFAAAISLNPDYLPPALLLAEMQLSGDTLDAAKKTLEGILARHPNNIRAQFLLGVVADRTGDRASAIELYRASVAAEPHNAQAMNNLAYSLADTKPDEALKYAQTALELAPDDASAEDTLGWIYYQKEIYPMALQHFRRAVQKENTAIRRLHLGLAYSKMGDTALAQQNMTEALKLDPRVASQIPYSR